jgi:phosphoglycolate phosphatase
LGHPPFSFEQVKAAMGYPGIEYYKVLLGDVERKLLLAFQREADAGEAREIGRIGKAMLFPGVTETLEELRSRGAELYVASTGHPDHINLLLDVTGIRPYFTGIYCGKPRKVEMTGEIIAAAGPSAAGEWVFIGDRHIDAEAARGNGIMAVGAGFGYCPENEKQLFDRIAEKPSDLLKLARSV